MKNCNNWNHFSEINCVKKLKRVVYIYVVAEESNFQTSNSLTKIENILNHWSSGAKVGLCYEKKPKGLILVGLSLL